MNLAALCLRARRAGVIGAERAAREDAKKMSRGKWAIALVLAVSSGVMSGCGKEGFRCNGIQARVVDGSGRAIANAQVSVVEMPPRGMDELVRMVHEGESLWGWHFTTDEKGRFCLTGIPTGGMVLAEVTEETPPYRYPPPSPEPGETVSEAFQRAYERAMPREQRRYVRQEGPWLGLVVRAAGYRPYIGSWRFPSPTCTMDAITLHESGQARLEPDSAGFTVTLISLAMGSARTAASDGPADATQGVVRTRVLDVPASALARYRASEVVEQPSWGPGLRGSAARESEVGRRPVPQQ